MFDLRLLFVALVWGVNFSVIKSALAGFHPLVFTVIRFFLASLFLFAVMIVKREPLRIGGADWPRVVLLGFTGITLYSVFFMYGLTLTTAANSALLISLSPLVGALFQAARGRERLSARIAAGLGLASFGVFLIITGRQNGPRLSASGLSGDLLTLCATIFWAVYTIAAKPLLDKYAPITITAFSMLAGSVLLLPLSLAGFSDQAWTAVTPSAWFALAFAAVVAAGIAYVLWYGGVKRIGVTRTMVYHYVMPFAAVLFAAMFLGERIAAFQIGGGLLILTGVYLVQSKNKKV